MLLLFIQIVFCSSVTLHSTSSGILCITRGSYESLCEFLLFHQFILLSYYSH